jgi:hypothetical protein
MFVLVPCRGTLPASEQTHSIVVAASVAAADFVVDANLIVASAATTATFSTVPGAEGGLAFRRYSHQTENYGAFVGKASFRLLSFRKIPEPHVASRPPRQRGIASRPPRQRGIGNIGNQTNTIQTTTITRRAYTNNICKQAVKLKN